MTSAVKKGIVSALRHLGYDIAPYRNVRDSIGALTKADTFQDSFGNSFERLIAYRDMIVPTWREMFRPQPDKPPTGRDISSTLKQVNEALKFLQIHNFSLTGKNVLEVGCHEGKNAFALARLGANHVDAIDIPAYGVLQKKDGEPDALSLERQSQHLHRARMRNAEAFGGGAIAQKVSFADLDVADLDKEEAYDLIISWETLEHITDSRKALSNMLKALRPGGLCFHEYNPFYSLNGGHSLCTLDFPYGHARLSAIDFQRYIQKYRPQELGVAMNFYNHCLNRMTIRDLQESCAEIGLEVLALCTWEDRSNLDIIDQSILAQCKKLKANVDIEDLLCPMVWVLARRPSVPP